MEFLLLGSLVIRADGKELTVPAPRQRVVLATLLLNANRVVPLETIADLVWDGTPPPSAAATVRTYVMRLRQVLGATAGARIMTRAPGYLIELDENESDLGRFTAHRRAAAALAGAGRTAQAAEELRQALDLWRHQPLMDVDSRTLHDVEVGHLQRLHLQTRTWRMDMNLELGRHAEILPELWRLVKEYPFHEGLVSRLMLALFRSGQQQEALGLFQRTRAALIDQLGTEPGPELKATQQDILRAGEESRPQGSTGVRQELSDGPGPTWPGWPTPAQLPRGTVDFTARVSEAGEVGRLLRGEAPTAGPAPTVVITGAGGIGKTALALHTAHLVRGDFDDGQLFVELEGSTGRPVEPAESLTRLLAALGVPDGEVPESMANRIALFRSLIARRRMLIVLDDAENTAQVRPLLPGSGESRVIVTSRHRLDDLEGAHGVPLGVLDEGSSLELLERIVGHRRIAAEPQAAYRIAVACAGLPLALRVVGCRLLARPRRRLGDLAGRLAEPRRLLDELRVGDLAVRTGLDAAYASLHHRSVHGVDLAAAFRKLGVGNVSYIRRETVAVLLDCSEENAEDVLDALVDAHLLVEYDHNRYHLDALSLVYAREHADKEGPEWRVETLRCLLQTFLHTLSGNGRPFTPGDGPTTYVLRRHTMEWTDHDSAGVRAALAQAEAVGPEAVGLRLLGELRRRLPSAAAPRAVSG
ncbi:MULTISPECIES: BTAD domain-containing putative transcriptional regulator [unclassified Streptomyces]|uniref:AfsR/SARP family transcriptional regulator n=1 Tax=unclassified Streptomyces TaxID=2593676 RepID=UPI0037F877E1